MKSSPTQLSDPAACGTFRFAARLLRFCSAGESLHILIGMTFVIAGAACAMLQPWPLKLVIDTVLGAGQPPQFLARFTHGDKTLLLAILCAALVGVQLLIGLFSVLSIWVLVASGLRMVFRVRCAMFDHVQRLSLRFHDSNPVGDSLYRITWDTYCVQAIFNTGLVPAVAALLNLIGISVIMLRKDWSLTLAALGVGVPIMALIRFMDRRMTDHSMQLDVRESDISSRVQQTLSGIRVVQAFGQETLESNRFRDHADKSLRANLRLTIMQALSGAVVSLMLAAGTGAVVWIAARRVTQGRLTPGDVVLLASYVALLYKPLETLSYTAAIVQSAVARGRRVWAILESEPDVADASNAFAPSARALGQIHFDNVSFGYEPNRLVLKNVDLDIPAGATVAFVGPSGAGKTTLVGLLLRFYDPLTGAILLDGRDIRAIPLTWLRQNVALVLQEPVLFPSSIFENIAYGCEGATLKQVRAAAEAAEAIEFIESLPEGFNTQVGERGVSLSGGQRQRISIARAFLKNAPILIMDEPTSALDTETESRLLVAMARLKQNRTTLIVAHRLSTIREADLVITLREGQVVKVDSRNVSSPHSVDLLEAARG